MNHQEERPADWVLMVYMGATSVLDSFAVESLKQMKRAAGDGIIVAAQFDASGHDEIRRLVFDGTGDKGASIENDVKDSFFPDNDKKPAKFLEEFILWAYDRPECKAAAHYCLILWTDGSLAPAGLPTSKESQEVIDNSRRQNFLLPVELRKALEQVRNPEGSPEQHPKRRKFEIIGMDACNMSMIEDVYELRECADFLIASEEEIPDASWPYEQLLPLFREHKDKTLEICRSVAREYGRAYQDYISNESTGLKKVTLSCLQLAHISKVIEPLKELAQALLAAVKRDKNTRHAVFSARKKAKSFVAGLFADAFGFCHQLPHELTAGNIVNKELESACIKVCNAISTPYAEGPSVGKNRTFGPQPQIVVGNETSQPDLCHGLLIYFPYSTAAEKEAFDQFNAIAKGGTDILNKSRAVAIAQIENYYVKLELTKPTRWLEFIRVGWSRCLIQEEPLQLDIRYSGQQCAIQLESYLSQLEQDCQDCKVKSAVA